ncbi:MAG: hypothetical protein HS113_09520 [Verrucomicrobiales bacterium]|nr:hypothetical protein [Verrucomicrobiales bacterium]
MFQALVATVLFAGSVIAAGRSAALLGSTAANFWRIVVATFLLGGGYMGGGLGGAFGLFFLSG